MQGEADAEQSAVDHVDSIASHLHHPLLGRILGDFGERNAARLQVQKEQDVVGCQPAPGEHFNREEVMPANTAM